MVQATIADALFDRADDGGLTIITTGGTDPVFAADEVDEVVAFLTDEKPAKKGKKDK